MHCIFKLYNNRWSFSWVADLRFRVYLSLPIMHTIRVWTFHKCVHFVLAEISDVPPWGDHQGSSGCKGRECLQKSPQFSYWITKAQAWKLQCNPLKIERYNANFRRHWWHQRLSLRQPPTGGCRYDNLRCHQCATCAIWHPNFCPVVIMSHFEIRQSRLGQITLWS